MQMITFAKLLAWLAIPICIVMYIEATRDIRKFFVRDIPLFIALVVGVWVYIAVVAAKRGGPHNAIIGEALVFIGVGLAVIHAVIRGIINKLKHVEERMDNIASDSDDAEIFFNVECESSLCHVPSKDHTVGRITERENTVIVVTYNLWWIFPCGLFFSLLLFGISALSILTSALGILILFRSFNREIIFDDNGITTRNKFFRNYEKLTCLPYREINRISYFSGGGSMYAYFEFISKEKNVVSICEPWHKNYKESLIYVVQKLPSDVFEASAREKLCEMGIYHSEW